MNQIAKKVENYESTIKDLENKLAYYNPTDSSMEMNMHSSSQFMNKKLSKNRIPLLTYRVYSEDGFDENSGREQSQEIKKY